MNAPLCRDCKWLWRPILAGSPRACTRPVGERMSVVDGCLIETLHTEPENERKAGRTWLGLGRERCGPEAKFFEKRPESKPPSTKARPSR